MTQQERQQLRAEVAATLADWSATRLRWKHATIHTIKVLKTLFFGGPLE